MRKYLLIGLPLIIVFLLVLNLTLAFKKSRTIVIPTPSAGPTAPPGTETIFSRIGIIKVVNTGKVLEYYVVLPAGEAVKLNFPQEIKPESWVGKKVLVSGVYNKDASFLMVKNISERVE